ncbi:hypothetical protein DYI24_00410 [Rhodopseudomonas sp. BR0C11]|uniref:exonuclease domain-containing protein n=1 Tax=Rhodopseudomonas sp. BR0C11 TaxID=2269370 RepID=UPI0013DEFF7B|nr:exonuclease domain-containing protein [Rhodopseudomonas sp. BR0C11]NEV75543.1 hypothetical protein [Rhodopseudomonas sp. BR0C11]
MIIRPCDLETTGKDTSTAEVVEVACCDIDMRFLPLSVVSPGRSTLVKPAQPIPASASAVHHITNADVKNAPAWVDAWPILLDSDGSLGDVIFAAHVASYEQHWIGRVLKAARWICTWKCALRQWPGLDSYSLQALRYELRLQVDPERASPPHRALPDSYVCGLLLIELLGHQTVETLLSWSAEPAVFHTFDFGQFKGKPWSAADDGYLDWIANKEHTLGEDWRWNARREINRRAAGKEAVAAAARREFVSRATSALARAATVRDLENWYHGQSSAMAEIGIVVTTDEYDEIIRACAARKAELLAGGGPDFGEAPVS